MRRFPFFCDAIVNARDWLKNIGHKVEGSYWQGVDVSTKPEMVMYELFNYIFTVPIYTESLVDLRRDINPNLPWADRHFEEERVSGEPINPGETWKIWPYGHSAENFLKGTGEYNHSYAERYWPKWAALTGLGGKLNGIDLSMLPRHGIRYEYADLNDLIEVLLKDPLSRQAYLPVWFPEDGSHMDRKPCTLGYHFIMRSGYFHINYYIRSCDIIRHFQDDIYLTVRLLLWVLDQLRIKDENWKKVKPGHFSMFITSLHCFANDKALL